LVAVEWAVENVGVMFLRPQDGPRLRDVLAHL
jgi:hypothetical protein